MLSLLAAVVLQTPKMPDSTLRLKDGDSWTAEYSYHYTGDDIDLTQNETTRFAVVREGKRDLLVAEWKLKESKTDGETIPNPPGVKSVIRKITLSGEDLNPLVGDDVTRHRIERMIQVERKGSLSEPTFFPVPSNVRLIGVNRIVELEPRVKDGSVLAVAVQEKAGDKPMKALGYYIFQKVSGILELGQWTIVNCPIPGGDTMCELNVTLQIKDLKLAPRQ